MHDSPDPRPRRSPLFFLARIFGLFVIVIGALLLGALLGYYTALFALVSGSADVSVRQYRPGEGQRRIALVAVRGLIDDGTADFARRAVQRLIDDERVGAVVLRVESPGGGATASDEVLHHFKRLREETGLPIVASYGDYAASGGYYVSCLADRIYAQPTTITGSIGVIAPYFTVHELLDKIGVEPQVVTSSDAVDKDIASMLRPWTEEDRRHVRQILDAIQDRFVQVVAEGRREALGPDEVRSLATGRGVMAAEALQLKLIDEIGYLDAALDHARELGGFDAERPPVVIYEPRASLGGLFGLSAGATVAATGPPPRAPAIDAETARRWLHELSLPRIMYLYQP